MDEVTDAVTDASGVTDANEDTVTDTDKDMDIALSHVTVDCY